VAVVVTGSIAIDNLMRFPGRFSEAIVPEQLTRLSLSFLVDDLQVRRGGVAANICFGLAQLGLRPVLVGAAGHDFDDYRSWLERHGVDTRSVRISEHLHTARFHCVTDVDNNQIASFYTGAMAESREIELAPVDRRVGGIELVVVSPNDPEAMRRHTDDARRAEIPFVADPSQQLARLPGEDIRDLVDGAAYLISNDYERSLLESKTGWSSAEVLERVGVRVTTHGADGSVVETADGDLLEVAAFPEIVVEDPTGVGDAFRAGFIAGVVRGLALERAAQLGSFLATLVLETVGTQEYEVRPEVAAKRLADVYGDSVADRFAEVVPAVGG
jgi:adenosine kinase